MKKWIPTILTVALSLATALTPQIQGAIGNHPNAAIGLATVYALLKGFLPSPLTDQPK